MAENHVIVAWYAAGGYTKTRPAFQYDYGQELQLQGFPELPASFEMHFSIGMGQAITRIGTNGAVAVPNACLERFGTLTAWLFLHDAETDGETKYVIEIPVRSRAKTTDQEPTPAEQSVITEAIAALNAGVNAAEAAQGAAETAQGKAEEAQGAAETAQGKAEEAQGAAEAAANSVRNAAATAETLAPGSDATVTVRDVSGVKTFEFGIPAGIQGETGNGIQSAVLNNDYTLTITYTDGTSYTTPSIRGATGNGIQGAVLNNDYTLTITYTDGTSYTTPSIRGAKGDTGATPAMSIGTVTTGAAGSSAAATMTGTPEAPVLNLTIPRGDPGNATIDDTAGEGDTTKVWSADKNDKENKSLKSAINVLESAVPNKVNKPQTNPDGTNGQLLRSLGNGQTEWTNVGAPTDEQVGTAVDTWLDEHPEATTTVEDKSLTEEKLTDETYLNLKNYIINPQMFGAIGDGASHKLSTKYSTLVEAQEVYSFADSLDLEIDYCAIQSCLDYLYDHDGGEIYIPVGKYMINKELYCKCFTPHIHGASQGDVEGRNIGTNLIWNGDPGTEDNPKYIIKFETVKPDGTTDPDLKIKIGFRDLQLSDIAFEASSNPYSTTNYVSAVNLGISNHFKIWHCAFGRVYDALFCNVLILSEIRRCFFYGVYRDCISIIRSDRSFSTTCLIHENEFGFFGRYAVYENSLAGSSSWVQFSENSIEGTSTNGYYYKHPSYFVQGIVSTICLMGQAGGYISNNRWEMCTYPYTIHFVNCNSIEINGNEIDKGFIFTCTSTRLNTDTVTQDYIDYYTESHFEDITDNRNYLLNTANSGNRNYGFIINGLILHGSSKLLTVACGWPSSTSAINFATNKMFVSSNYLTKDNLIQFVPISNGELDYENAVDDLSGNKENIITIANNYICLGGIKIINKNILQCNDVNITGAFTDARPGNGYNGWGINNLAKNPLTAAESLFLDKPFIFCNVTNGTTSRYYEVGVCKKRKIRYEFYAAPTVGTWTVGDICYAKTPTDGGYIGWVCVESGTPGTWKGFGLIGATSAVGVNF